MSEPDPQPQSLTLPPDTVFAPCAHCGIRVTEWQGKVWHLDLQTIWYCQHTQEICRKFKTGEVSWCGGQE